MSMVTDLIAAVTNAERQLDEQIMRLNNYQSEIESVKKRTDLAFSGSSSQYGQKIMDQLIKTDQQITDTIGMLKVAKEKLTQVRMI